MKISFTPRCPVPLNVNKPPVKTLDAAFNDSFFSKYKFNSCYVY